ncbi:MAG: tail fiber domain-containing protein [Bacteroidales bacterium]|nr:tail fiber domain-containing protein [Bacteroidales bacterium]MCF8404141.1 tail fiber domain-containing protein [Bacteroidales bacterium]
MKTIKIILVVYSLFFSYSQINGQLRVISNGSVGILNSNPLEAFQIGDRWTFHNGGSKIIGYNFHYSGGDKRIVSDYASSIRMDATGLKFAVSGYGSAESSITWSYPLWLKSDGKAFFGSYYVSYGSFVYSDIRLKENIKPISNAIDIVNQLNGKTYNLKADNLKSSNVPQKSSYGLIAQEVQKILPDLVLETDDSLKTLAIDYDGIIPFLIEAFKEQQIEIIELKSSIENLNSELSSIEEQNEHYLFQNSPNPFDFSTKIQFSLPDETKKASIVIYDMEGKIIKRIKITDRGRSDITFNASSLSSGIYTYSLVADGTVINTSKMVIK